MNASDIGSHRLQQQQIARQSFEHPGRLVSWLGAVQAQDFAGAKWSLGLRLPGRTDADIEQAIADKSVVRTWPMRGTLHFVAAADVRWMLQLLTPRVVAGSKSRLQGLGLDEAAVSRSYKAMTQALQGGRQVMRKEVMAVLERAGISTAGQRGYHLLWRAAQAGLICQGCMNGKQQTFTLLDEWVPPSRALTRDEALAEIARRYFTSHGPATLQDFLWWTGLAAVDARAGIEMAKSQLIQETVAGKACWMSPTIPTARDRSPTAYLLPGFDEYLLGYRDRSAVLAARHAPRIAPGANGVFNPTIVIDGQVAGTWKRTFKKSTVTIALSPFASLTEAKRRAVAVAAEGYGKFLGLSVMLA
jgi:hypothetical protein